MLYQILWNRQSMMTVLEITQIYPWMTLPQTWLHGFCSSCHGIHNPHNNFMAAGLLFLSETCMLEIFGYYPCLTWAKDLECRVSIPDVHRLNRPHCPFYFMAAVLATGMLHVFIHFQSSRGWVAQKSSIFSGPKSSSWFQERLSPLTCLDFSPNGGWETRE